MRTETHQAGLRLVWFCGTPELGLDFEISAVGYCILEDNSILMEMKTLQLTIVSMDCCNASVFHWRRLFSKENPNVVGGWN